MRLASYGENHPEIARCIFQIQLVQLEQGNFGDLLYCCERVEKIYVALYGENSEHTLLYMSALARELTEKSRFEISLNLYVKVLEIKKQLSKERQCETRIEEVETLEKLSQILFIQEHYEQSLKIQEEVLEIKNSYYKENHIELASSQLQLALILLKLRKKPEAKVYL